MNASSNRDSTFAAFRRRLDALALEQLRSEASRLAEENERLRTQLTMAEDIADFWRREATEQHLQLCEATLGQPGITQAGQLVVVPKEGRA